MFTKSLNVGDQLKLIAHITFAGSSSYGGGLYHWRFYAAVSKTTSVLFDIIPGADGQTGVVMVSSKPTNTTTAEQHSSHTIQVAKEFTIEQLIGWIGLNNLDRYRFTPEGTGCRHWCVEILKRMEGDDVVPTGSTDQFVSFLAAESKVKPSSIPEDTGHGSFY